MRPPRGLATFALVLAAGLGLAASTHAQDMEDLAPYKMIRSLQYVQDTVVMGDHSAMEMQRFMLSTIDERLRTADPSIFADPRNVDAALVYAMSGGNPQTLELLAKNDVSGHFDQRITEGVKLPFFGRPAWSNPIIGILARHYETPVYACRTVRRPGGRFWTEMTAPLEFPRDAKGRIDADGANRMIHGLVESWIREYPEQWLWQHRRWRED